MIPAIAMFILPGIPFLVLYQYGGRRRVPYLWTYLGFFAFSLVLLVYLGLKEPGGGWAGLFFLGVGGASLLLQLFSLCVLSLLHKEKQSPSS
jgi:hypothetical protein